VTARSDHRDQPSYVVDAAGEPIQVGGVCGLYVDLQPEDSAPMRGDWVATEAGSRYLVDDVHLVRSARHRQVKRYRMRVLRLPKDVAPPDEVNVIWLRWYPRARRTR